MDDLLQRSLAVNQTWLALGNERFDAADDTPKGMDAALGFRPFALKRGHWKDVYV